MIQQVMDTTTFVANVDTITNTKIYLHETVKLIEPSNNLFVIYVPIFIAMLALVFSVWQFALQRKERKIKIKPVLTSHSEIYKNKEIKLNLVNEGVGIAKIKKVEYSLDSVKCKNLPDLIAKKLGKEYLDKVIDEGSNQFVFDSDLYIPSQGKVQFAIIKLKKNKETKKFVQVYKQVKLSAEYYNMYDEKMPDLNESLGVLIE